MAETAAYSSEILWVGVTQSLSVLYSVGGHAIIPLLAIEKLLDDL
jgi:hypothetical protein